MLSTKGKASSFRPRGVMTEVCERRHLVMRSHKARYRTGCASCLWLQPRKPPGAGRDGGGGEAVSFQQKAKQA